MNHQHAPLNARTPDSAAIAETPLHTLGLEDLAFGNALELQGAVGNAAIQDGMNVQPDEPDLDGLLGMAAAGVPFRSQLEDAYDAPFGDAMCATGVSELADLGADAISVGDKMLFASASPDKSLVGHEAAHFVQNQAAGASTAMAKGDVSDPSQSSEVQADAAGKAFASGAGAGGLASVTAAPAAPAASIQRSESNVCVPKNIKRVPRPATFSPGTEPVSGTDVASTTSAVVTVGDDLAKRAPQALRMVRGVGHAGSVGYNLLNRGGGSKAQPNKGNGPKTQKPGKAKGNGKQAANKRNRGRARNKNYKAKNNYRNNGGRAAQNARSAQWARNRVGGLVKGAGKVLTGGMNIVGAGASGIDAMKNSKNTTTGGKLLEGAANTAVTGAAGLTPAGLLMAAEGLMCKDPKNKNVTGLANSTASSVSGLIEAGVTGNAKALRKQTDHNLKGNNGTFVQTLTQAGDIAGEAGGYVANKTGSKMLGGLTTAVGSVVGAGVGVPVGLAKAGWNMAKSGWNSLFGGKKKKKNE